MNKTRVFLCFIGTVVILATSAQATNGDNLIGIGPISRAMGGVGIAAPQDSISAVFSNPAGMCFAPYCNASTFDFAGTLFMPKVDAKIVNQSGTFEASSNDKVFAIPAIGISTPLSEISPAWRFGIAAYGVSGLGVDYRGTSIDNARFYNPMPNIYYPMAAGSYTQLQIMKFAPTVAVQALDKLSLGLSLHIDYATLDLRDGSSPNYGYGFQAGALFQPVDKLSVGLTYASPQTVNHKNVSDFDSNGVRDDLELEAPQQVGFGIAYEILDKEKFLIEADTKWINWSDAKGYKDFDWRDQWVYAVGAQFKPADRLSLRAGFNYGKSPVKEHDGFNGTTVQTVQDASLPGYYYETFRIIGFPAVVEKHVTFGAGFQLTKVLTLNAGYMHAFEKTVSETGTDLFGNPVTLESKLSETSYDFGMTWLF